MAQRVGTCGKVHGLLVVLAGSLSILTEEEGQVKASKGGSNHA